MVKPFMSKKLRSRVALYGSDTAAMLAAAGLSPDQVPPEYGGTLQGFDPAWYLRDEIRDRAAAAAGAGAPGGGADSEGGIISPLVGM